MDHTNRAFTLIELLIVVAIIAILAAIAVPNFLEAQTRAKVSRTRADVRSLVTALESYMSDNNRYPCPRCSPYQVKGILYSGAQFVPGGYYLVNSAGGRPGGLTTPIAYLTSAKLKDPFAVGFYREDNSDYFYQNTDFWYNPGVLYAEAGNPTDLHGIDPNETIYRPTYGLYKAGSLGPDRDYTGGKNIYDPTNGTISVGDIYRSQKRAEGGGM
ncbi:MAG: prepilin-type N-terminal cleavage/methylation domain-containing protein [bacterium]|nr:prepilin-type N-terminal cleavage/methylation domain-containing protein [Candidatus Sumerlaeota bacterium]